MTDPFAANDPNPTTRMPLPAQPAPAEPASAEPSPAAAAPAQAAATLPPAAPPSPSRPAAPPPAWRATRDERTRLPSVVFGLVLLAVGLWFFAEHTLGLDLPTVRWSQLWPLILIGIGAWVLLGTRRGSR